MTRYKSAVASIGNELLLPAVVTTLAIIALFASASALLAGLDLLAPELVKGSYAVIDAGGYAFIAASAGLSGHILARRYASPKRA